MALLRVTLVYGGRAEAKAAARVGREALGGVLRLTDIIAEVDHHDGISIACPDTDAVGVAGFVRRLGTALEAAGYWAEIGWACFPADGLTLEALLERADRRMREPDAARSTGGYEAQPDSGRAAALR